MELTKASSRSMLSSYSSECDCYLCQYGTGCQYVEPYPFYPTLGNPLVYFAKTKTDKNSEGKKPNAFVRAFRWYTERPNSESAPRDRNQAAPILNQENQEPCVETCQSVCRDSDRMNMTGFARWLDDKYEQFLLENSDGPYVCDPDQSAHTETLDPNTQTQPQNETCKPICPKKNRFPRLKSPWKKHRERSRSMDKGCPKECGIRHGEKQQGSMEYILPPNNVSRAASVCCYPTPSSCCSVVVKSQSMTSCNNDCAYNQEVEIRKPVVLDNPPVEQKFAKSFDGNVTKETKPVEKKEISTNISCQCCLNAISNDAQTQYETIKASSEAPGPNTPLSSASNAPDPPPQQKKSKFCPKKKKTIGDSSKKNLDSSNISTTSTQTKSNVSSPNCAGLRQDAHSQYEQPEDCLLGQCPFYNAPCPSFQKPIPNQREPCPSLQEPCPGRRPCPTLQEPCPGRRPCPTLQPEDRSFDPCPSYNAPCPSFQKLISNQREPFPSLHETCPGHRPCPTLQPEDHPFDPCPSYNVPYPSFQKSILNQREPCPSLQEPCPGRRPCPTLQEPCPGRQPCPTLQPEDRPFDPCPSYNAPCPSFQKLIPNQREPFSSLHEPHPGRRPCPTLQPEDRSFDPCPSYNAPCPSFLKLIPDQREPCPSLREPCPGRRPCPTLHGRCPKYNETHDSCRESDLHVCNHGSHLGNSKHDDSHEIPKISREINRNVCGPCLREDCSDHCRVNPKIDASNIRQKPTLNQSELTPNVCKPRSNLIEECSKFNETKYKSEITTTCRDRDARVNDSCPSPHQKYSDNCTISNRDTNSICRGPIPKVGEPRSNKGMQRCNINAPTPKIGKPSPNVCKPYPGPRKECSKFNETTSKPKFSTTPRTSGSYLYNPSPSLREECSEARSQPSQPGPIISVDNSNVCKPCPSIRKECSNYKETSPNGDVKIKEPVFRERTNSNQPQCSISKQAPNHQATCPTLFENKTGLQTCTGLSEPNKNQKEYRRKSETNNIPIQSNRETVPNIPMESSCKPSFNMRKPSSSNCEPRSSIPEPSFNFREPTCYQEAVPNHHGPTPPLGRAYPNCHNARFNCYYVREACPGFREICATQVQCPGRFETCLGCCCPNCGVFHESNINDKQNEPQPQRYYYPHPYVQSPQQNTVITIPAPVVAAQEPVGKCSADCPYYKNKIEAEQTTTNNQATEAVSEQVTVNTVQTSNNCIQLDTINKYPFFMKIVCADRLLNEKISN